MGDKSNISWTDATWNPVVGCEKVSPGCANCYAVPAARRLAAMGQISYEGLTAVHGNGMLDWSGEVRTISGRLDQPLHWKKARRVFVNSMSDLFHEQVPDEFIDRVFAVMAMTPQHTYQILTKRPERMLEYMTAITHESAYACERVQSIWAVKLRRLGRILWPLPNVWLGTSVEDQRRADERIPLLLQTPAAVRFLSCEPLLEPLNLQQVAKHSGYGTAWRDSLSGKSYSLTPGTPPDLIPWADGPCIDWVIVGGESGPGYRPMDHAWVRSIRDQCRAAGVPFFFKQSCGPRPGMAAILDGVEHHEFPAHALAVRP